MQNHPLDNPPFKEGRPDHKFDNSSESISSSNSKRSFVDRIVDEPLLDENVLNKDLLTKP